MKTTIGRLIWYLNPNAQSNSAWHAANWLNGLNSVPPSCSIGISFSFTDLWSDMCLQHEEPGVTWRLQDHLTWKLSNTVSLEPDWDFYTFTICEKTSRTIRQTWTITVEDWINIYIQHMIGFTWRIFPWYICLLRYRNFNSTG